MVLQRKNLFEHFKERLEPSVAGPTIVNDGSIFAALGVWYALLMLASAIEACIQAADLQAWHVQTSSKRYIRMPGALLAALHVPLGRCADNCCFEKFLDMSTCLQARHSHATLRVAHAIDGYVQHLFLNEYNQALCRVSCCNTTCLTVLLCGKTQRVSTWYNLQVCLAVSF